MSGSRGAEGRVLLFENLLLGLLLLFLKLLLP